MPRPAKRFRQAVAHQGQWMKRAILTGVGIFVLVVIVAALALWVASSDSGTTFDYENF